MRAPAGRDDHGPELPFAAVELLLEVLVPGHGGHASLDVAVDVEPSATVGELTTALARHAARAGHPPPRPPTTLVAGPRGRALVAEQTVREAAVVSGDTVVLDAGPIAGAGTATGAGAASGGVPVVSMDIAAGPQAGRFVLVGAGTHRLGRSSSCELTLDDPTVSRHHVTVEVAPDGTTTVEPIAEASNATLVGGHAVSGRRDLAPDELLQLGATALAFRPVGDPAATRRDLLGQIPFNRVPYHRVVVRERTFEPLARPPEQPRASGFPVASVLLPLVGGVGIALVTGYAQFLVLTVLSPLMLVARWASDSRGGRRSYARESEEFRERLDARVADVAAAVDEERQDRLRAAPDVGELARHARFRHRRLWERDRRAADFLSLRLGLGDVESKVKSTVDRGGDPELRRVAEAALAGHDVVRAVPITVALADLSAVGFHGDARTVVTVATSAAVQAACLHSPEDLVVAAAVPARRAGDFAWLKWLPHTRSSTSPLDGPHVAVGPEETHRLLVNLQRVAADRVARRPSAGAARPWPMVLLVVHEDARPDRALLSQVLDAAGPAGVVALWLGHDAMAVPRQCRATLACADPLLGARSRLRFTDPDVADREVEVEGVQPVLALEVARSLAPVRDATATTATTAIPRRVLLLDALGMPEPTAAEVERRWRGARPTGLRAPVGLGPEGTFSLDLVGDGPHALVAGTSGAGKSELLQTLVASLAATYPPDRLTFLFVDYKGGASTASLRALPHAVGYVTNLDGRLSMRALTSLRAELRRRMAVLEGRAKDLDELVALAPGEAPPSLVIVVDEFATLVKEVPDFVAGIVDVAQRGRSLGIHLVLATQRPAGAVNDNILANTNLRVALRVLDAADSTSVIGSKEAADIPVPLRGRAYARTGPARLCEFQCAWSGAPFVRAAAATPVVVADFRLGTPAAPVGLALEGADADAAPADAPTQLEVLVEATAGAARRMGLPPAPRPWVEPLPELVALDTVLAALPGGAAAADGDAGRLAVLGLVDDPERQAQHPAVVDLEAGGGLLVLGTGGVGKTTVLRTVAAGLAGQGDARAVQLYGLDFASRALLQMAPLPHCAAVATGDDPEKVTRILTVLADEVARRRVLLADAGAETLTALRAARGQPVVPRLVVLVDGYGGFQSSFDRPETYEWVGLLQRLVPEGRPTGVHFVVTGDRRASIPSALLSAVSSRVILRMADSDEMALLGVPGKAAREAELPPGRGFLGGAELQVACVGGPGAGASQAEALATLGRALSRRSKARAAPLPELPETVPAAAAAGAAAPPGLLVVVGITDLTLAPATVDLGRGPFVVAGPAQSGKSTALGTVASGLRGRAHLVGVGGATSPLAGLDLWDEAAFDRSAGAALVEALAGRLELAGPGGPPVVVFVDEADDVEAAARPLERLTRLDGVHLAVAVDPATLGRAFSGWLGALRRDRRLLLLQPESRAEVEQLSGAKTRFRPAMPFPPGRGVLVADRGWSLVQVAVPTYTDGPSHERSAAGTVGKAVRDTAATGRRKERR